MIDVGGSVALGGSHVESHVEVGEQIAGRRPGGAVAAGHPVGHPRDDCRVKSQTSAERRVSTAIVEDLRRTIRGGQLRPGDRLPTEGELSTRFHVSRVIVREALRVLQSAGLIDVKVGAHGGAFVATPTGEHLGDSIAELISFDALTPTDVVEARIVLEVGIVPIVCRQATNADIADLLDIHERSEQALRRGEPTTEHSARFHSRIAQATHNSAIEQLVRPFRGHMRKLSRLSGDGVVEMRRNRAREHKDFVMAVIDRDVDRAVAVMTAHLGHIGQHASRD